MDFVFNIYRVYYAVRFVKIVVSYYFIIKGYGLDSPETVSDH